MSNTNISWTQMSDVAVVEQLGKFIKHTRIQKNITQAQLAESAGLNRWTISQIEKGESIVLMSLIQILRALDSLYVLSTFEITEEISPLEYAKLKKQQKKRVRNNNRQIADKEELEW